MNVDKYQYEGSQYIESVQYRQERSNYKIEQNFYNQTLNHLKLQFPTQDQQQQEDLQPSQPQPAGIKCSK